MYPVMSALQKKLVIAVLETFDISHIYGKILLPFDRFDEVKMQKA